MPLKMIYIDGAIRYPGLYALQAENEKVASVYNRAGGFRADANIRGITVKRARKAGDTIDLVLNSRKAIHRHRSKYNVILKGGDYIYVPYAENLVTITGDVNKMTANDLGVFYTRNKRAIYYIRNFGGGFTETSDKKHVIVQRANGARVSTHRFLFVRIYPKVKPGSKIVVTKKMEEQTTAAGRSRAATKSFQTDAFLNKLLTRMTAVLSLIGLYRVATAK